MRLNKRLKVFLIFLLSLLVVSALLQGVLRSNLPSVGKRYLEKVEKRLTSSSGRLAISYSSLDRTFLSSITIHDFKILLDGEEVVAAKEAKVSAGVVGFVRMALGKDNNSIDISFSDPRIVVDGRLLDYFSKKSDLENETLPVEKGKKASVLEYFDSLKNGILEDLKTNFLARDFNVNLENALVKVALNDFYLQADGFSLGLKFSVDSGVTMLNGSTQSVSVAIPSQNLAFTIGQVDGSLVENGIVSIQADSIDCGELFSVDAAEAYLDLNDFPKIKGTFHSRKLQGALNGFEAALLEADLTAELSLKDLSQLNFSFASDHATVTYSENTASLNRIEGLFKLESSSKDLNLQIHDGSIDSTYGNFGLEDLSCIYNSVTGVSVKVGNLTNQYLFGDTSISFDTDDFKLLKGSFHLDTRIIGDVSYNLESGDAQVNAIVQDLRITDLAFLYRDKVGIIDNFLSDSTSLSGNLVAGFNVKSQKPDVSVATEVELNDLKVGSLSISMNAGLEASLKDNVIDFYDCYYSIFGKTISFAGSVDLEDGFPTGRFAITDNETSTYIAHLDFAYETEANTYSFEGAFPYVLDSRISGKVELAQKGVVKAQAVLYTKYKDYPVDVLFDQNNDICTISASGIDVTAQMDDKRFVTVSGKADGFEFSVSKDVSLGLDCIIDGGIDLFNTKWNIAFRNFKVKVSDTLSLGFNLNIDEKGFALDQIELRKPDVELVFDGGISATGIELKKFTKGDFSNLRFKADLSIPESDQYLRFAYTNATYWADVNIRFPFNIKFSLLGSKGTGNAHTEIGPVSFDFNFNSQGVVFENATLGSGTAALSDVGFYIDFKNRSLNGSFKITNTLKNNGIKQGTCIEVSAKLDSLRATALSFAGIEAKALFDVNMKDTYLGDFKIKDNQFKLTADMKSLVVEGEYINGSFTFKNKEVELNLDKSLNFGLSMHGTIGKKLDLMCKDLWFDSTILNQFFNTYLFSLESGTITGDLLVNGPYTNPKLYGMLYSNTVDVTIFYLPDQVLSLKGPSICLNNNSITMGYTDVLGYSYSDGRQYAGKINLSAFLDNLHLDFMNANIKIESKPIDLWLPLMISNQEVMMRGDIVGSVDLGWKNNKFGISGDINVSDFNMYFKFPPELKVNKGGGCNIDLNMTFGKDVKMHYPDLEDPFLTFTFTEGTQIKLVNDVDGAGFSAEGDLTIKSGRINYINNELIVTDGKVHLSRDIITGKTDLSFDATARLREYDSTGKPVDIYFVFQNSTFNNLAPKMQSSTGLSENEILKVLGQQIVGSENRKSSFSSLATLAASATSAIQSLGLVREKQYSIGSSIKNSLNLDVFSLRSQIFQNIIIDSIPITGESEKSLLAKYLDGTSLFVGKYIGQSMFIRGTAMLNAVRKTAINSNVGHFISDDLNLDFELSFDWDVPFGTLSMFSQPQELSVFSFVDNFGISLNNHIKF